MTRKLDPEKAREGIELYGAEWDIGTMQVAIYVACGGGWIGLQHAEQPLHAYIDDRVGKLPYSRKEIENMRAVLVELAKAKGLDPDNLPAMPKFHTCGVF